MYLNVPLPQNYRLLVYARFSKDEQRQQSIADQDDFCREFLNDNGPKPGSSQLLSDEGISGELHSRPGIDLVRAGIRDRRWDLIVVKDSSRLFRGVAPCMDLVGWAVDQRIRVICINDFVDTANEDWQQRLVAAITDSESRPAFVDEAIAKLAAEEMNLSRDEQRLTSQLSERRAVPEREVIEQRIRDLSLCMNTESERAKALLPQLLDGPIRAVPYQPLGNKNVVLKAEFTLRLAQLLPDELRLMLSTAADRFITHPSLKREQTVELFQRSKSQEFALQAVAFYRALESPPTLEQLGTHLGISKRTAHLALQLGKQLDAIGLSDPFVRLTDCPSVPARWRFKDAG